MPEPIIIKNKITKRAALASKKFGMIEPNDKILVGFSGGKDSTTLLHTLIHLKKKAPFDFEIKPVIVVYGMGEDYSVQKKHCEEYGIELEIWNTEIFDLAKTKMVEGSSFCSFFSRMRRGALYEAAKKYGCNKLALGHHLDDAVESFLMNTMYNGSIRSLPPKYTAENGITVIRPLCTVREKDLREAAENNNFPTIGDEMCPGMQFKARFPHARNEMKELMKNLETKIPEVFFSLEKALSNIHEGSLYIPEEKKPWWKKIFIKKY